MFTGAGDGAGLAVLGAVLGAVLSVALVGLTFLLWRLGAVAM
jgi:hypothetical protein